MRVRALFWELVLIRWLGATIRVVAYFSNLVLISAFFGLGIGALLARFGARLERLIAPARGPRGAARRVAGRAVAPNPGGALRVHLDRRSAGLASPGAEGRIVPVGIVLVLVYGVTAAFFAAFGQYIGRLFRTHRPLRAYSVEVGGSLAGIALFALLSQLQAGPIVGSRSARFCCSPCCRGARRTHSSLWPSAVSCS